jgi:hypothetical protein
VPDASPKDRWYRYAQLAALAASAIGAIAAGRRILAAPALWNDQPLEWARVAGIAAIVMLIVIARWPRHAATAVTLTCVIAASALMTPGPVAVCALLLGAAYIAGRAALGGAMGKCSAAVATLVGVALLIGFFEATLRLRIHYPAVHASIAIGVLVLGRATLRSELGRAWSVLAAARTTTLTERAWIAIAGVVAVLHFVIAARPEIGYDASTMHLQFAEHVAKDRSFRFGVDRYAWAMMPLGADYLFASAYLLGGEAAARAINLAFGVIAASLVFRLARTLATREAALASVTLFAAMPLALLVTGALFSETLWVALLLASLVVVIDSRPRPEMSSLQTDAPGAFAWLPAFALLAGAAMATKVMSAIWLAFLVPVALWFAHRDGSLRLLTRRDIVLIATGVAIGAFPYVVAWVRTGNPVFPFMNALFGSPLFPTRSSFNNPLYNAALMPWTPWDIVLRSARYIEGRDGAIGLAWLFAWPLFLLHLVRRPGPIYGMLAALAALFFVAVFTQQSYLRYLLPALALVAVLASAPLAGLVRGPVSRALLLVAGVALVAFDIRAIGTASYPLAAPCLRCLYDANTRHRLVADYAPLRVVSAFLNRELPQARVGFLLMNEPTPSGYVGYSRSANWHDYAFFARLAQAGTAEAIAALVREHQLTYIVYRPADDPASKLITEFATRHATPVWRYGPYWVAAVQPSSGG